MEEVVEYRGYKIKLFHNSGKWDYFIPNITEEGYPSKRTLYQTKGEAIVRAKTQIDNRGLIS